MNPAFFGLADDTIVQWGLDHVDLEDPAAPVDPDASDLGEHLAELRWEAHDTTMDVGWVPAFDPQGGFRVAVFRGEQWALPIFEEKCTTWVALREAIARGVAVATAPPRSRGS